MKTIRQKRVFIYNWSVTFKLDSACSTGRIVFKRPTKNADRTQKPAVTSNELKSIFNLNNEGVEIIEEEKTEAEENESAQSVKEPVKKKLLGDEEDEAVYGLQAAPEHVEQPAEKRGKFCDRQTTQPTSLTAAQVKAREAKAGNKKLLSFNFDDEEAEENEDD